MCQLPFAGGPPPVYDYEDLRSASAASKQGTSRADLLLRFAPGDRELKDQSSAGVIEGCWSGIAMQISLNGAVNNRPGEASLLCKSGVTEQPDSRLAYSSLTRYRKSQMMNMPRGITLRRQSMDHQATAR
jgi:hypothetical protein